MSALVVNFKTLYQRRALVWVTLFVGLFSLAQVPYILRHSEQGEGVFSFLSILCLLGGLFVGLVALEVRCSPVAWCLPHQARFARRFVFLVGIGFSGLLSLCYAWFPAGDIECVLVVMGSSFFLHMGMYAFGVYFSGATKNGSNWLGCFPLVLMLAGYLELHTKVEWLIVTQPIFVLSVNTVLALLVMRWWGGARLGRRLCNDKILSFMDAWSHTRVTEQQQSLLTREDKRSRLVENWLDAHFDGWVQQWSALSIGRQVFLSLYHRFSMLLILWKLVAFLLLFVILFMGYAARDHGGYFALGMLSVVVTYLAVSSGRTLWAPCSRKQEIVCQLVASGVLLLVTTFGAALLVGGSYVGSLVLPAIPLQGEKINFLVLSPWCILIPLLTQPLALCVRLIIRNQAFSNIAIMFVGALTIGVIAGFRKVLGGSLTVWLLLGFTLLCMLIYVISLRYICLGRDWATD